MLDASLGTASVDRGYLRDRILLCHVVQCPQKFAMCCIVIVVQPSVVAEWVLVFVGRLNSRPLINSGISSEAFCLIAN